MADEYTLVDAIDAGIHYYMVDAHTAIPGEVVSYDSTTMKAEVKVSINREVNGKSVAIPNLPDVPVVFPRSNAGGITFEISSGDGVLLIFSERVIDTWKNVGSGQPPPDNRMFDLSGAFAIPGAFPVTGVMVPPAKKGTELRGKKIFIGDAQSLSSPIITAPAVPPLGPLGAVSVAPQQLNLLTLMGTFIDLVSNAGFGTAGAPAATGTGGPIDAITKSALATLKSDLERITL